MPNEQSVFSFARFMPHQEPKEPNKSEHSTEWVGAHSASVLDVVKKKDIKNDTGTGLIFGSLFVLPLLYLFIMALLSPNSDFTTWSGWVLLVLSVSLFSMFIFLFIIPAYKGNHFRDARCWAKAIIYWAMLQFVYSIWIFVTGTSPSKAMNYREIPREVGFQPLAISILCLFVWVMLRFRISHTKNKA